MSGTERVGTQCGVGLGLDLDLDLVLDLDSDGAGGCSIQSLCCMLQL